MKKSKSVLLKSPANSTVINGTMGDKKEIELLKQKLKKSQKKYNDEKELRERLINYNHDLLKKVSELEDMKSGSKK